MINTIRRPLGINEKIFWVLDQKVSTHFAIAVELEGNETVEAWIKAIDTAQARHPNLFLNIKGNHYSNLVFEENSDARIPLTIVHAQNNYNWNSVVEQELSEPFDLTQGPLARAILVQQAGQSVFIFISNHSIGDGMSVALVIRDILNILSGAVLPALPHTPSMDELAGLTLQETTAPRADADQPAGRGKPWSTIKLDRLALSATATTQLISRAKSEHTTVHTALTAAFILAGRQLRPEWQDREVRILHPVSPRKHYQTDDAYGLLSDMITLAHETQTTPHFWDLARAATVSIAQVKPREWQDAAIRGAGSLFTADLDLDMITQQLLLGTTSDMMLTNMGNLPFESDYGKLQLKSYWGPMVLTAHHASQTVGVATFNGQLTLTITSAKLMTGLLEAVEKIIQTACQ